MHTFGRIAAALLCCLVFACAPCLVGTAAAWAQTAPAVADWPHTVTVDGRDVVVYQPQAISWTDQRRDLKARAAIAITQSGQKTPLLGTVEVEVTTAVQPDGATVMLSDAKLLSSRFPTLDTGAAAALEEKLRAGLPRVALRPVPVQSILLSLKDAPKVDSVTVQNDPPIVFHSEKPASLVVFDGDAVTTPIGKTGLSFAVNTNWDVFTDGHAWWLFNNGLWYTARAASGPYTYTQTLPPAFRSLPADTQFADARKSIPPAVVKPAVIPAIYVSTKPAVIIVTQGAPQFVPVQGTRLQSVKNTNSTLFFDPSAGKFYLLVSGRWFSAGGLDGPWQYATDQLPPDFALIPPDSAHGAVLASVPGTPQAQTAVLQAQIPKQATLKKDAAKVTVTYAGPPVFKPIPGTAMMYAVNTPYDVIETGGQYYVCYQGAWFVGATPTGPFVLAAMVPPVIYTIPPSFPLYPVTYVKVYAATPTAVTYGYTAGYTMGFVSAGVLVYGTGYYYPPVVIPGPVPVYYPYPYSYTGNVWYNSSTGAWAHGGTVYGPYGTVARGGTMYNPNNGAYGSAGAIYGPNGGAGGFSYYNPSTGGYAHGSASWSGGSGTANAGYYNPRTGVTGSTNQNWNQYQRWGSSTFAGPNQTVNTRSGSNANGSAGSFSSSTGAQGAGYHTASGNRGGVAQTKNGDVYAGHDGNVYQHSDSGWSKWNNGSWNPVNPPQRTSQPQSTGSTQGGFQNTARQPRESMNNESFQQLEQDRGARFSGFSGGRMGGGGHGRFR